MVARFLWDFCNGHLLGIFLHIFQTTLQSWHALTLSGQRKSCDPLSVQFLFSSPTASIGRNISSITMLLYLFFKVADTRESFRTFVTCFPQHRCTILQTDELCTDRPLAGTFWLVHLCCFWSISLLLLLTYMRFSLFFSPIFVHFEGQKGSYFCWLFTAFCLFSRKSAF